MTMRKTAVRLWIKRFTFKKLKRLPSGKKWGVEYPFGVFFVLLA